MHKIPELANLICQLRDIAVDFEANGPKTRIMIQFPAKGHPEIPIEPHILLTEEETAKIEFADEDDLQAAIDLIKWTPESLRLQGHDLNKIRRRYRRHKKRKTFTTEWEAWYAAINP